MPILNKFLTKPKFDAYQKAFYTETINSPQTVTLSLVDLGNPSVPNTPHSLRSFLKSTAGRESTPIRQEAKCLYEFNLDNSSRSKVGLSDDGSTIFYLSPLQIINFTSQFKQHIPTFREFKDFQDNLVIEGYQNQPHKFLVERVEFLEALYNSCLAIEFTCKIWTRG
jgi:hypothetical protein